MAESFAEYMGRGDPEADGGEGDDEAALAAMSCLDAIVTLLYATAETPEIYESLTPPLLPLLLKLMELKISLYKN